MKNFQFPVFKTKSKEAKKFDLLSSEGEKAYFDYKAGEEIKKMREYLKNNTFVAYLLGKKNGGKGTYAGYFSNLVGEENISHISIGDIVRGVHADVADPKKKEELVNFLKHNYRGYISIEEAIDRLLGRDTVSLLPTEFILALVKKEISEMPRKSLLIDGFPRDMDQVSYSLYFRDLIDYRDDPDLFILIDVPEAVIDERIKHRVVCPKCHNVKNLKLLLPSKEFIRYDKEKKEFYFACDNPECKEERMVSKEGDNLGIEAIRERLEMDEELIRRALNLHGIPKVLLRNDVPQDMAKDFVDDYELTPEYSFEISKNGRIEVLEKPWIIKDDSGILCHSLLAQPVTVSLVKQVGEALSL